MRKCVKCKIQKHRISQCLWTKNRGKVTAFRDAELVFSPLSLSYKLTLFLLIADFKMRTSWMQMRDARRCGKLTDYTDCSKSGAVCPKRFSKELFSFGKSWTGNARPCDILSGQIGKTLLPLSQNSMWPAWARLPLWQWDENEKTNPKNCNNENNTDSVYSIRIWQTLLAVVKILEWPPNTSPHITRQLYKRSKLVKLSIESIYRFSTWFGTDSIQWTLWRW